MKKYLGIAVFIFNIFTLNSYANIHVTGVTGASSFDLTTRPVQIMGGTSGVSSMTQCTPGDSCPNCCNTCVANNLNACNLNAVTGRTLLTISFVADRTGLVAMYENSTVISQPISYQAGTTGYITIPWYSLCSTSSLTCTPGVESLATLTLGIGKALPNFEDQTAIALKYSNMDNVSNQAQSSLVDSMNGVSDFNVFSGTQKVFLTSINIAPQTVHHIVAIRAFYEKADKKDPCSSMDKITNSSPNSLLGMNRDGSSILDNRIVGSFEEGKEYIFRMAIQDDSGNIGYFTDKSTLPGGCDPTKHAAQVN